MGNFKDYRFADVTQQFNWRKGQVVPPRPKAQVILYAPRPQQDLFPASRFFKPKELIPAITERFRMLAACKKPPVTPVIELIEVTAEKTEEPSASTLGKSWAQMLAEAETPRQPLKTLDIRESFLTPAAKKAVEPPAPVAEILAPEIPAAEIPAEEPRKRPTLTLKTKITPLAAKAAAIVPPAQRRHPLSHKSWAELLAEAETPKKPLRNLDLANAFKNEMRAFAAEQEKLGLEPLPPVRMKTAFERKTVSPQPADRVYQPAPKKTRILAA